MRRLRTPTRYVIVATGSRFWADEQPVRKRFERYPAGTILLHGDAVGLDQIADAAGRRRGFVVVPVPYFSDLHRAGGPARNALLVALGVTFRDAGYLAIVEAFPMPDSVGTVDCVGQAEAAGLPVVVTRP